MTATAFAGTTGNFTIDSKHTVDTFTKEEAALLKKHDKSKAAELIKNISNEVKIASEVKLGESGVTLGGDATFNDAITESQLKKVNANVRYDFTTGIEGLKSYIKGNVKFEDFQIGKPVKDEAGNMMVITSEAGVSYEKDGITYSLTSKTDRKSNMNAKNKRRVKFNSEHEVKLEGKKDKIEDLLVSAKLSHGYKKNKNKDAKPFNDPMYLLTDAKGAVKVMDGLKIGAHNKFDILFNAKDVDGKAFAANEVKEIDEFVIDGKISFLNKGDLAEMFKLYATYDKNNVEATAAGIVEYIKANNKEVKNIAKKFNFGVKLDGKYKAIENVELGGSLLLAGKTKLANKEKDPEAKSETSGLVRLGVNVKYTAKVNDKLTVTPEVEAKFNIENIKASTTDSNKKTTYKPSLGLSVIPTVGVEFKATDAVTLTASGKATVTASRDFEPVKEGETAQYKFEYKKTALEAKLGLKYTW